MNRNLLIGLGVFIAIIIVGFFLVKSPAKKPSSLQTTTPATSTAPVGPVKEFSVSAKEYGFIPSTISVSKGDNVKITFTNNGTFSHNLTFSDLGVGTDTIAPGETATLEFTADKVGSFTYVCTVDSHKDKGMQGTLVVK